MSITISVGANGAATGRTDQTIPGDGEIDNRAEAEAALTFLPENSTNTVKVGGREYTRAQLIEIRDRAPAAAAPANNESALGDGISHGIGLDGYGLGGFGDFGHTGGGARLTYTLGVPVLNNNGHRLWIDPSLGVDVGHMGKDYQTPGGEGANSAFTRYGGRLGVALRYSPSVWANRLWASLGLGVGVHGFSTADSTTVSTPGNCVPGDFGRAECEPTAGPLTGNAGTTGLLNPRVGSSRGTSGLGVTFDVPLTIGVDVLRGDWGSGSLYGFVAPQYTSLFPSDGDGAGYWGVMGGGGFQLRFGGSGAARPRVEAPAEPTVERTNLREQPAANEAWSLDPILRANLPEGANVTGVSFDGTALSGPPYSVPAARMTPGSHTLRITYRMPGESTDRIKELTITVAAPVVPPNGGGVVGIEHNEVIERPRP